MLCKVRRQLPTFASYFPGLVRHTLLWPLFLQLRPPVMLSRPLGAPAVERSSLGRNRNRGFSLTRGAPHDGPHVGGLSGRVLHNAMATTFTHQVHPTRHIERTPLIHGAAPRINTPSVSVHAAASAPALVV